jgi:hypothetical protein
MIYCRNPLPKQKSLIIQEKEKSSKPLHRFEVVKQPTPTSQKPAKTGNVLLPLSLQTHPSQETASISSAKPLEHSIVVCNTSIFILETSTTVLDTSIFILKVPLTILETPVKAFDEQVRPLEMSVKALEEAVTVSEAQVTSCIFSIYRKIQLRTC